MCGGFECTIAGDSVWLVMVVTCVFVSVFRACARALVNVRRLDVGM